MEDVEVDAGGVGDGKASVAPGMIFEGHDGGEVVLCDEFVVEVVGGGDEEVVGEALALEGELLGGLRRHELDAGGLGFVVVEGEGDVPAAVEEEGDVEMFEVEGFTGINFLGDDAGGEVGWCHGVSRFWV